MMDSVLLGVLAGGATFGAAHVVITKWVPALRSSKKEKSSQFTLADANNQRNTTYKRGNVTALITDDLFIGHVTVGGTKYDSAKEAFMYENVKKKIRKELREIELDLVELRKVVAESEPVVKEVKNEAVAEQTEAKHKKNYKFMNTEHDGEIYCYNACTVLLSPYVSVEISVDKETKNRSISMVTTSQEGIASGSFAYFYDLTDSESIGLFEHNVMNNKRFAEEASMIKMISTRISKFNSMMNEGRILYDAEKKKFMLLPKQQTVVINEVADQTAEDVIQQQFDDVHSVL